MTWHAVTRCLTMLPELEEAGRWRNTAGAPGCEGAERKGGLRQGLRVQESGASARLTGPRDAATDGGRGGELPTRLLME